MQAFGNIQLSGYIVQSHGEIGLVAALGEQLLEVFQVPADCKGALVSVFRQFGQQAHRDSGKGNRQAGPNLVRRSRCPGDVLIDQFQVVVTFKRQLAGQQLVESHAQGVEV